SVTGAGFTVSNSRSCMIDSSWQSGAVASQRGMPASDSKPPPAPPPPEPPPAPPPLPVRHTPAPQVSPVAHARQASPPLPHCCSVVVVMHSFVEEPHPLAQLPGPQTLLLQAVSTSAATLTTSSGYRLMAGGVIGSDPR